jgi:hypothetical protein
MWARWSFVADKGREIQKLPLFSPGISYTYTHTYTHTPATNFWAKVDFHIGAFFIINGGVKQRDSISRQFLLEIPMGLRPYTP